MSRRNKRVTLRWTFAVLAMFGWMVVCSPPPADSDDGGPDGVRVQTYHPTDSRWNDKVCLIFTHDTAQGASIAVVC